MSINGVFMLRECPNINGNRSFVYNANNIVRFNITQQLLSEIVTFQVQFDNLLCIKDYYKREKSGRYEAQHMTTVLLFKYSEYQLMANIINLQGVQAFENFLWTNIRSYYSEVYNLAQIQQSCSFEINKNIYNQPINDINNRAEVLGNDLLQYLNIVNQPNHQQAIINSLIVRAY